MKKFSFSVTLVTFQVDGDVIEHSIIAKCIWAVLV